MTTDSLDVGGDRGQAWQARAQQLRQLHQGPDVLVLPNAWDRLSARLLAGLPGCQALATTSAGIAAALGYPDGQRAPLDECLGVIRCIVQAVELPVSADFEAGYGQGPAQVAENVARVVAAGAVGINLEDSIGDGMVGALRDPAEQVERLQAARAALQVGGVPGVLNARVDVLMQPGAGIAELAEAIRRCQRYAASGADCVFVPGLPMRGQSPEHARRDIATLVREAGCAVNLLASPLTPPVAVLRELGVRRVSTGSGLMRLAYASARAAAGQILAAGCFDPIAPAGDLAHGEVNRMLG
jgi:2-methylisocitrate lyase-like PEP mutase family enzyme